MNKYIINAKSVGILEATIEAESATEAHEKLDEMLMNGELEEIDGYIENKEVEKI